MFSTIPPMLMSITVFVLTIICIRAGVSSSYQNYSILNVNTTVLKANSSTPLPIPDVYLLFLETYCSGNYASNNLPPITDIRCSPASTNSKFILSDLIAADLRAAGSNATVIIPEDIQRGFNEGYNIQLRVALIFYILALIFTGITLLWGILCFFIGALAMVATAWTSTASTFLFISSVIVTVVLNEAQGLINDVGAEAGLQAYGGGGFLALTWSAFAINAISTLVWPVAGGISAGYRDD